MCALFARDSSTAKANGSISACRRRRRPRSNTSRPAISARERSSGAAARCTGAATFVSARCRDGYVMHCTLGDWTSLIEWVNGDGKAQDLTGPEWEDVGIAARGRRASVRRARRMGQGLLARRVAGTRATPAPALCDGASVPRISSTTSNCWRAAILTRSSIPNSAARSAIPARPTSSTARRGGCTRRPPLLGEHTGEILGGELGMSADELAALAAEGVI